MSAAEDLDPVELLEKRRAERRAKTESARRAQYAKDLAALVELEDQYGDGRVATLPVPSYVADLPTMAVVRTPAEAEGKRFRDRIRRLKKGESPGAASDELARSCLVYPDADTYARMCVEWPALHDGAAERAIRLMQAKADDEGKD